MNSIAKSASAAGPIDAHVGARIRLRRTLLGMSQEKLGAALGLTFQQVQKYERGTNKVGASRLYEMSKVLGVPIGFFFDNLAGAGARIEASGFSEAPPTFGTKNRPLGADNMRTEGLVRDDMSLELLSAYSRISNARVKRQLLSLVKSIAESD